MLDWHYCSPQLSEQNASEDLDEIEPTFTLFDKKSHLHDPPVKRSRWLIDGPQRLSSHRVPKPVGAYG